MEEQIINMPAVALRGLTILPGMIAHFDVSRERSLRAVEEAMEQDQKIYLVTQRNVDSEDPTQEDLYQMGIVADIKQDRKSTRLNSSHSSQSRMPSSA